MRNSFVDTGGARIGDGLIPINISAPFARLECTAEAIAIHVEIPFHSGTYRIEKNSVEKLSEYDGFFSKGIRIFHRSKNHPQFIVFWTGHREVAKAALQELGYLFIDP